MKAILTFDEGSKIIADILTPPARKECETQSEYEHRICKAWNASQPHALHKLIKVHLTRV